MSDSATDGPTQGKTCPQPDCSHPNAETAAFCVRCGESLDSVVATVLPVGQASETTTGLAKRCSDPACGHSSPEDAHYCCQCGRKLPATIPTEADQPKSPFKEITQPFIDLYHAPRALWGVNLAYLLEGMVYFGMLSYLAMFFNDYVGLDDVWAGRMLGVLTAGITISMFFFGGVADKWGVRFALLAAFCVMLAGRVVISLGPSLGLAGGGMWSPIHLLTMGGILLVIIGYGMYQPGAYAAVRQFTTPKTAAMGFAMLYALMNLGGWLPSFFSPIRNAVGISGAYWVYTGFTVVALAATFLILSRRTVRDAIAAAKAGQAATKEAKTTSSTDGDQPGPNRAAGREHVPLHLSVSLLILVCAVYFLPDPWHYRVWGALAAGLIVFAFLPARWRTGARLWLANHPLADAKFYFFIFCLIPVQTLFAHNWLTLPMYVERGFRESWPWISTNFEAAVNFNPLLIFIFVPIVTALTQKRKVYNMMILGTFIMAAPTFLLAFGAKPWTLVGYLIIMTIGEAMWQPRFLQYAAEIAPEGRTGAYMGVAQFPWFLTKVIVPLYSGWFLQRYCPDEGVAHTETMWLIYACIAMASTIILILARSWVGKDFKTKAA
ncbi:MAG: MFS transporter [bacterium]|nr:MFS transporter [bacterium]